MRQAWRGEAGWAGVRRTGPPRTRSKCAPPQGTAACVCRTSSSSVNSQTRSTSLITGTLSRSSCYGVRSQQGRQFAVQHSLHSAKARYVVTQRAAIQHWAMGRKGGPSEFSSEPEPERVESCDGQGEEARGQAAQGAQEGAATKGAPMCRHATPRARRVFRVVTVCLNLRGASEGPKAARWSMGGGLGAAAGGDRPQSQRGESH